MTRATTSRSRALRATLLLATGLVAVPLASPAPAAQKKVDDVTVVAVIDSGISPYHWDFLASKMPQALNRDPSDNLPLNQPPHTWVPGFPAPSAFRSYNSLKLSLENNDDTRPMRELHDADQAKWDSVKMSGPGGLNYYWVPGTKVIGAMSFEIEDPVDKAGYSIENPYYGSYKPIYGSGGGEHGMGSASVSTGNIYGTCPECLLVFLQFGDDPGGNRAIEWAMKQPWIDVVTNSYGCHTVGTTVTRDNICGKANTALQKAASERGQTIFWSAGNGYENAFVTPNQTLLSSQKGPDWIITVTASNPAGTTAYSGAGKPADVAGVGSGYPSAYGSSAVTGGRSFSGTSNATPTIAGLYGRALYLARRQLAGPSNRQANGVIAVGRGGCASVRKACELGDGKLTASELRFRLLQSATHRVTGTAPGGVGNVPKSRDEYFAYEGHGTYLARVKVDDDAWLGEFNQIWLPLIGKAQSPARPAGEREWMIVDSWCRQHIWGAWSGGYYVAGKTTLPAADAQTWPTRTAYATACQALVRPPGPPPTR